MYELGKNHVVTKADNDSTQELDEQIADATVLSSLQAIITGNKISATPTPHIEQIIDTNNITGHSTVFDNLTFSKYFRLSFTTSAIIKNTANITCKTSSCINLDKTAPITLPIAQGSDVQSISE